jgi:hypothetical protein
MVDANEPQTALGRRLRARMSDERWVREVGLARGRAAVLAAVADDHERTGQSWRRALAAVAPDVSWPTYRAWRRKHDRLEGPAWERLLDERVPPSTALAEAVEASAVTLRQLNRSMTTEEARGHLARQYGEAGAVSDAKLRRIWAAAGLNNPPGPPPGRRAEVPARELEEVGFFNGGAGLALLAAADLETGTTLGLARAIERVAGGIETLPADEVHDDRADRDERGRFTASYNARRREEATPGEVDERWAPDAHKAARRDLSQLRTRKLSLENLASKLFAMGATPLLTERRGFDGLAGPAGAWLGVSGAVAYMPATLDKLLAELGLLAVGDVLWDAHAAQWSRLTRAWSEPEPTWLQTIAYIDGTADPYWTRAYALSGKVSRVGRVMPCLTRVALNSGAGVPLLVETHVGAAPLKRSLGPMLARLRTAVGPEAALDRLTVVDSEAGKAGVLWALHKQHDVFFISVLKGAVLQGANLQQESPWQAYRDRDELCESGVHLFGVGAPLGGLRLRAVQMRRPDSRHPQTTVFATNAGPESLTTEQVASIYLARWPKEEQTFRDARNGGGLNRSYGYGRAQVTHVALADKLANATADVARAEAAVQKATKTRDELAASLASAPRAARAKTLKLAIADVARAERALTRRQNEAKKVHSLPATIQQRDTGRDGIMTCLKVSMLALVEFVLKEYFGGASMEWRTFIEQVVALPVTVRTTKDKRRCQIHANPRQPALMARLATAIAEVNRRAITQGERALVFELVHGDTTGS